MKTLLSVLLRQLVSPVLVGCLAMTFAAAAQWIGLPYQISDSGTFVRYEPYIVADPEGGIHLFWSQDSQQQCCIGSDQYSLLRYARFKDGLWRGPIDVVRVEGARIDAASVCIDSTDTLHLAWVRNGQAGMVYTSSAPLEEALSAAGWSTPVEVGIEQPRTNRIRLRVDDAGTWHLVFSRTSGTKGIFYSRSSDGGSGWSAPVQLETDLPEDFTPQVFQFEIDPKQGLHVVWNDWGPSADANSQTVGRRLAYSRSTDGGLHWSPPFTLDAFAADGDPLNESVRSPHGIVFTGDQVHVVWTGGPPGAPTGVGRKYRGSENRGADWGEIQTDIFGVWGAQNGDGLAADDEGLVHWVGLARKFVEGGQLWEGLWGADWNDGWSEPTQVVTKLSPGIDSPRLASSPTGQRVASFRSSPDPETGLRYLYATHDSGPVFYFPHCVDGSGVSVRLAINNLSDQTAVGRLTAYDQSGDPQALPFEGIGLESTIDLTIPPKGTEVFSTLGTSDPLKVGFVRVELDQSEASGVLIFKYSDGREASVLPASPGRRFALFVERTETLRTGVAFARVTPNQPITLSLYTADGTLRQTGEHSMKASQEAYFVDELLDVEPGFQGLLVVDSPALLTAVGLRFGAGVLSTIPVIDLDSEGSVRTSFLFPQVADAQGLSVRLAINNLDDEGPATGTLSFVGADGAALPLPLETGSQSTLLIDLPAHGTLTASSLGTSDPPKVGFVTVETSPQSKVSGVAIFAYASGPEASVLPSSLARRVALFGERSTTLDTGVAVAREGDAVVTASLYDEVGHLVDRQPFPFPEGARHGARFLGDIFPGLSNDFRGTLLLESEGDFGAVGLRFGGGALSTIPVVTLTP